MLRRQSLTPMLLFSSLLLCAMLLYGCGKAGDPDNSESSDSVTFDNGVFLSEATEIAVVLEPGETELLERFGSLSRADLSGSTCYEEIAAYSSAHPEVNVVYSLDIGGEAVNSAVSELDLCTRSYDALKLVAAAPYFTKLETLALPPMSAQDLPPIAEAFPGVLLICDVLVLGKAVPRDVKTLDMTDLKHSAVSQLAEALPLLPELSRVELGSRDTEEADESLTFSDVALLQSCCPDTAFAWEFTLFGQTVSTLDQRVEFIKADIGNEGTEVIREALPVMKACEYLLLDDCGVDNEVMAQLRDDFPETKVVWRVRFCGTSCLTDVQRIWRNACSSPSVDVLKYCTDVLYLDLGHHYIRDLSFLACMPKLQVCMIPMARGIFGEDMSYIDLSPIAACSELEYLEIFGTEIADLTPLAGLSKLEHLNISDTPVTDLSPLSGLTNLKRLWSVSPCSSEEEQAELMELLPNCDFCFKHDGELTGFGWRYSDGQYTERYALLREQIGY